MHTSAGEQTISLSQKDTRFYADNADIKYSNFRVIVAKKTDDGLLYINNSIGCKKRDTYVELGNVEEGEYLIYVSIDWRPETLEEDRFFNITSYGSKQTKFSKLEKGDE